jgi:hypothetical protein
VRYVEIQLSFGERELGEEEVVEEEGAFLNLSNDRETNEESQGRND